MHTSVETSSKVTMHGTASVLCSSLASGSEFLKHAARVSSWNVLRLYVRFVKNASCTELWKQAATASAYSESVVASAQCGSILVRSVRICAYVILGRPSDWEVNQAWSWRELCSSAASLTTPLGTARPWAIQLSGTVHVCLAMVGVMESHRAGHGRTLQMGAVGVREDGNIFS